MHRAGRAHCATLIADVDVLVLQIARGPAYLSTTCWIRVNFLYENYAEARVAMTVIPHAASFPFGRDIFYMCERAFYTLAEDRISFLV